MKNLIIPGSIGAFAGACLLGSIPGNLAKPYVALFLLILGFYVLCRFLFRKTEITQKLRKPKRRFLVSLGLIAGFVDSTGGGGWGPMAARFSSVAKGWNQERLIKYRQYE